MLIDILLQEELSRQSFKSNKELKESFLQIQENYLLSFSLLEEEGNKSFLDSLKAFWDRCIEWIKKASNFIRDTIDNISDMIASKNFSAQAVEVVEMPKAADVQKVKARLQQSIAICQRLVSVDINSDLENAKKLLKEFENDRREIASLQNELKVEEQEMTGREYSNLVRDINKL